MKTTIIVDKKNEKVTNQVSVKKADTKNPAGKEKKAEKVGSLSYSPARSIHTGIDSI